MGGEAGSTREGRIAGKERGTQEKLSALKTISPKFFIPDLSSGEGEGLSSQTLKDRKKKYGCRC